MYISVFHCLKKELACMQGLNQDFILYKRWPVRGAVYQLFFKGRRKRKKGLNALLPSQEQRGRGSNMLQMFPHGVGNGGAPVPDWVQSTLHKSYSD